MEITISIFIAITAIIIVNTILDHLFNWWFRNWSDLEVLILLPILLYTVKTIIIFSTIKIILT